MHPSRIIEKLGPIPGAISGTATICATAYDSFSHPGWRFGAWAATAGLLWWSALVRESYHSVVLDTKGEPTRLPSQWRSPRQWHPISLLFAIIATAVLLFDIAFWVLRSPADFNYAEISSPDARGYTVASSDNELVRAKVRHVDFAKTVDEHNAHPFGAISFKTLIQKRRGVGSVLLRGFAVRVVRFEPMPKYRLRQPVGAMVDKLEISFLLSQKRGHGFPWLFDADHVRLNYENVQKADDVPPVSLDDVAPTAIGYCLNASDPGIYWVEPIIKVSAGIGNIKELVFTEAPVPIAFAGIRPNQFTRFQDEFDEVEVLKGIDKTWIPWPPISEPKRRLLLDEFDEPANPAAIFQ